MIYAAIHRDVNIPVLTNYVANINSTYFGNCAYYPNPEVSQSLLYHSSNSWSNRRAKNTNALDPITPLLSRHVIFKFPQRAISSEDTKIRQPTAPMHYLLGYPESQHLRTIQFAAKLFSIVRPMLTAHFLTFKNTFG